MEEEYIKLLKSSMILVSMVLISIFFVEGSTYKEVVNSVIHFLGGSYLMSSVVTKPLQNFITDIQYFMPESDNPYIKGLKILNSKFENNKNKLNKHNIKIVKNLIEKYKDNYKQSGNLNIKTYIEYFDFMVDILKEENKQEIDTSEKMLNGIKDNIDKIVSIFGGCRELETKIKENVIIPIVTNKYFNGNIPVSPIYIYGSPGTGKTHFVNIISKYFDIPLHIYNEQKDTFFSENIYPNDDKFEKKFINVVMNLYQKTKSQNNNIIFFMDEFDKLIENVCGENSNIERNLLSIIGVNGISYSDNCHDAEFNTTKIIIICTGNKEIESEHFKDRFINIKFPDITAEQKRQMLYKNYSELLKSEIDNIVDNDMSKGYRQVYTMINSLQNKKIYKKIQDKVINL